MTLRKWLGSSLQTLIVKEIQSDIICTKITILLLLLAIVTQYSARFALLRLPRALFPNLTLR